MQFILYMKGYFSSIVGIACVLIISLTIPCMRTLAYSPPSYLLEDEKNTISIFKKISPYVVHISSLQYARVSFFSFDVTEIPAGTGTGFIWNRKGYIVTNYHVIKDADKLTISFKDGNVVEAKLIGFERRKDIAVVKVAKLPKTISTDVELADSSRLYVGQKAIAIGNPFGLDQTLTKGIISALGRSILGIGGVTIRDMIQTDASINPGNSGGPLLDSRGKIIGMNTMIYSKTGSSTGIGFAVPANTIKRIVNQLLRYGKVKMPGLGIVAFDDNIGRQLRLKGVLIRSVVEGLGAKAAGLRGTRRALDGRIILGDIIIGIGNEPIKDYDDLYNVLEKHQINDRVKVIFLRRGRKKSAIVQLSEIDY